MPLPGEASSKFGERYEGLWTVLCMADVLDEKASVIRLAPPGNEGDGVEFWLQRNPYREYHQVKRQIAGETQWTLGDLSSRRVLKHFYDKLNDSAARCVFVSLQDAPQLRELVERAEKAVSLEEFQCEFLNTKAHQKSFQDLRNYWGDCPENDAFTALRRIEVRTVDERTLRNLIETKLFTLIESNPSVVLDVLTPFALDHVHDELTAHDIWTHLEKRGMRRRQWHKDPHVQARVEQVNSRYMSNIQRELISGESIPRTEQVQSVVDWFNDPNGKRGMLVTGEAGGGKSSVLSQTIATLKVREYPVLAFRVDRLTGVSLLPDKLGEDLGLPGSPANVLAAIAHGRESLLVIDQLDAVSLASGRNPELFECIQEIIDQALTHGGIRLLLACRQFDIDNDYRLRKLAAPNSIAQTLSVGRLSLEVVQNVVSGWGMATDYLSPSQWDLLTVPLHLKLLSEIAHHPVGNVLDFHTEKDLFDRYWDYKQHVLRVRLDNPVPLPSIAFHCQNFSRLYEWPSNAFRTRGNLGYVWNNSQIFSF